MRLVFLLALGCVAASPALSQTASVSPGYGYPGSPDTAAGYPAHSGSGPSDVNGRGLWTYDRVLTQARKLIAAGDYADADTLLNYHLVNVVGNEARFLKGVASLGTGDTEKARGLFEAVVKNRGYRHPGAMSGLAVAQVRLGNVAAAREILVDLQTRQQRCGESCRYAAPLEQAITVVEKAVS